MAIRGFATDAVQRFFLDGDLPSRAGWRNVSRVVPRKLDMMDYAARLTDLEAPPGNRLEALRGDRSGFFSIRVNQQWRIVFRWTPEGPTDVDVVGYHRG